jgi:hypothetical protein
MKIDEIKTLMLIYLLKSKYSFLKLPYILEKDSLLLKVSKTGFKISEYFVVGECKHPK